MAALPSAPAACGLGISPPDGHRDFDRSTESFSTIYCLMAVSLSALKTCPHVWKQ